MAASAYPGWWQAAAAEARALAGLLARALREFRADRCQLMAAAIAYHLLFSLFPLALAGVAVLGLFTGDATTRQQITDSVLDVVPLSEEGSTQLKDLLASVNGAVGALGIVGLLGALWSASGVMTALRISLNLAWDAEEQRPFLRGKLLDLLLVGLAMLVVLLSFGLTIVASLARRETSHVPHTLLPLAGVAASVAAYAAALGLLFLGFLFLFRVVPVVRTRVRDIWVGALVAAVGFELVQLGFSVYIAHLADYNRVYGSLGVVIAFLFYVYVSSAALLYGAEVAAERPRPAAP